MTNIIIHGQYTALKTLCASNWKSTAVTRALYDLSSTSLHFLMTDAELIDLISRVPNKTYKSFRLNGVVARPANASLFVTDVDEFNTLHARWLGDDITVIDFARLSYTTALAPCLAMELFDRQNKKGPATYFECYIGHLFAREVGINPQKRVRLPVGRRDVLMTMDFLFDLGGNKRKVHVPVKMSTRERVVQAWAHQRLLEAAYGETTYRGIMVLFSETKMDSRSLQVVEICVPDQWLAYQALLAKMDRIYYFDMPERYDALTAQFPEIISIKQFGQFFREREEVLDS